MPTHKSAVGIERRPSSTGQASSRWVGREPDRKKGWSGPIHVARQANSNAFSNRDFVSWLRRLRGEFPSYRRDLNRHQPTLKKIAAKTNSIPQQRATWSISGYCLVSNWS